MYRSCSLYCNFKYAAIKGRQVTLAKAVAALKGGFIRETYKKGMGNKVKILHINCVCIK